MNSIQDSANRIINDYWQMLRQKHYSVLEIKKEGYAYSFEIVDSNRNVKILVYFGKKGAKTVIQGNSDSNLKKSIESLIFGEQLFDNKDSTVQEPKEYIGTDESGKGDYFGPLIVAGVFTDESTIDKLKNIGVRDSKELTDDSIKIISKKIKNILINKSETVIINPEKYNQLYQKFGNLNKMLAWAHSRVIENLVLITNAGVAISDKFGNEKLIQNSLMEKGKQITLHQFHKAEKYTAVAAASILAREKVIDWFHKTSKEFNIRIPKGASEQVNIVAKSLKQKLTGEEFNKLIKLHFKNSKYIEL
jgi:ribonuclease HIII